MNKIKRSINKINKTTLSRTFSVISYTMLYCTVLSQRTYHNPSMELKASTTAYHGTSA